ncbi:hypothetical protein E1B28_002730 [Marasmius oreades]|uniref:Xylanolytic transcriptional activator regulatory domain-containing protein n=1 Tax=Marasmius oreades TaxID=181124 RepID=A0A9P7RN91_9AGAR|nr:uncharacterized protein E1B28_002730 [Marasmius oreades]KAG7086804.1 hypothetical protein E1B28_002730 [Marasmius oreades]
MPGNICSNCIMFNSECTHVLANSKKRGAPKPPIQSQNTVGYPQASASPTETTSTTRSFADSIHKTSSTRQELTDSVLSASYVFPHDLVEAHSKIFELASYARYLEQQLTAARRSPSLAVTNRSTRSPPTPHFSGPGLTYSTSQTSADEDSEEGMINIAVSDPMKRLALHQEGDAFYGKSSDMVFIKSAIDAKAEYTSSTGGEERVEIKGLKRPEFWNTFTLQWQRVPCQFEPPLDFPSPGLMSLLIQHFFDDYNVIFPLLHRPTFEKDVTGGRHLFDARFGLMLLSVCAIGSRFLDLNDERLLNEGVLDLSEAKTSRKHSLGWRWYRQIGYRAMSVDFSPSRPDVCEVQLICNCIMFLQPTSTPDVCWLLLGHGVRYAVGAGVHRKSFRGGVGTYSTEKELWKRAFWCLVTIDTLMSAFLGRPRATNPADYDLEFPVECDDEYWDQPDPEQNFKQPSGKPCIVSGYVQMLKLVDIFGFAQRTIYSVRKSQPPEGITSLEQDQAAIKELDQALNEWIDNIPDYLRWNPHMYSENKLFFNQSSTLHAHFYWVQIQIHRPFLRVKGNRHRGMAFSSLAVCANAARSCSHVMDVQCREGELPIPFPGTQMVLFNSAVVLLLNIWGGKKLGVTPDPVREMNDVYKCLNVLRSYEERWQIGGRLSDILTELISVSDLNIIPTPSTSLKRPHPSDHDQTTSETGTDLQIASAVVYPGIDYTAASSQSTSNGNLWEEPTFSGLPLYTRDLGRLPLHGSTHDLFGGDLHSLQSSSRTTVQQQSAGQATDQITPTWPHLGHDGPSLLDGSNPGQSVSLNSGALAMWSGTPGEYGWEDWSSYVSSIDDILRSSLDISITG